MFQLWIVPDERGLEPGYEDRTFALDERRGHLVALVTDDGRDGSLRLHRDAAVYGALLDAGATLEHGLAPGRGAWVQLASGRVRLNDVELAEGDGAALEDEAALRFEALEDSELVLVELGA